MAAYLRDRFPQRLQHVKVEAHRIGTQARDTTQRSRTLLVAALGHAVAQSFGARKISFFENGIVSHNLPISPQVVGTMATRTTHPLALHKLNQLLDLVRPGAPPIRNGYAWLTKTEVVQRIAQHGAADQIRWAVSCTSVREQTTRNPHCGSCSQCLDRRFAILAAQLGHEDPVEGYKCDVLLGPRGGQAATMAVEWSRHALRMARITPMALLTHFGPELIGIIAGHPTLSAEQAVQMTLTLHRCHAAAVQAVLTAAIRANAANIAEGSLAAASLLMMHIGTVRGDAAPSLPPDPRLAETRVALPAHIVEEDRLLDPTAPLEVAFFKLGVDFAISVKGLCDINGKPAMMAHGFKTWFDEDRSSGLPPDQHRFMLDYRSLEWNLSPEAVRKAVERCRKMLAKSYVELFGVMPPAPLLIQNKPVHGYRLDPLIRLATRPQ